MALALFLEVDQSGSQGDRFIRFTRRLTGGRNVDAGFLLDEVAGLGEEDSNPAVGRINDPAGRQAVATFDLAGHVDFPPLIRPSFFSHACNRAKMYSDPNSYSNSSDTYFLLRQLVEVVDEPVDLAVGGVNLAMQREFVRLTFCFCQPLMQSHHTLNKCNHLVVL